MARLATFGTLFIVSRTSRKRSGEKGFKTKCRDYGKWVRRGGSRAQMTCPRAPPPITGARRGLQHNSCITRLSREVHFPPYLLRLLKTVVGGFAARKGGRILPPSASRPVESSAGFHKFHGSDSPWSGKQVPAVQRSRRRSRGVRRARRAEYILR